MKAMEDRVAAGSEYYLYTPSRTAQRMFFYPTQCGLFTYEPGYRLSRNAFDSFLLMFIRKGSMLLDFGDREERVEENSFVLLDCYEPHGYSTQAGYECLWLHFDGVLARDFYEQILQRMGNVFALSSPFEVIQRLEAILRVFREDRQVREPQMSRYIHDILTEFMLSQPRGRFSRDVSMAEQAISYINGHFSESVTVEHLAALSRMSLYHFIRVFRKETGYTPHEYLTNRRMASARYLLKYTGMSVKEIGYSTGFSSESVFCNAFRKHHAMSPLEYRTGEKGDDS